MANVSTAIISGAAELRRRSSRAPEYERESRALVRLARAQTGPRDVLLQTIVDAALELCCAGSAGISLVEELDGNRSFRWLAVAGQLAGLRGNLTAWNDCPCGIALELQESLLLVDPLQTFEALRGGPAYITEGLVADECAGPEGKRQPATRRIHRDAQPRTSGPDGTDSQCCDRRKGLL